MKTGKILAIIGAVLSFFGILFFTLINGVEFVPTYGIQGFINIPLMFGGKGDSLAWGMDVGKAVIIVMEIVIILYLISWLFQFFFFFFRIFSLLGSIPPLIVGIFVSLYALGVTTNVNYFLGDALGSRPPLVERVLPFHVPLGTTGLTLGTILVLLGAIISFVSVFMKREDITNQPLD
ncbi:MAG: hypothetical protein ACTSRX_00055 [Promethearchaeota archaeon]